MVTISFLISGLTCYLTLLTNASVLARQSFLAEKYRCFVMFTDVIYEPPKAPSSVPGLEHCLPEQAYVWEN